MFAPNYLPATRYGGPIRSSHGLAKSLVNLGHEVDVVTTNVDGTSVLDVPLGVPVELDGVQVHYFPTRMPRRLYYSPDMLTAVSKLLNKIDLVHINGMFLWPGSAIAAAARKAGKPYIVSPRGMLVGELIRRKSSLAKRAWLACFDRRCLSNASVIHVTAEVEAAEIRALGLDLAPLIDVPNGIDLPEPSISWDEAEADWRDIPKGRRLLFLARIDWKKGADLAIDVAGSLDDVHLILAGYDQTGLRSQLEERAVQNGARNRIHFLGPVEGRRKWTLLKGADLLIMPSLNENFGIVGAEAMAMGTPIVAADTVGVAEYAGRLEPLARVPRTLQDLSNAVKVLLDDTEKRDTYGRRAAALVVSELTWPAIAKRMSLEYESCISLSEYATRRKLDAKP
jgi:glycosyltransferase involved in cell wall biosynthesis